MRLEYTPEQVELRAELRAFMAELMTPELDRELIETHGGGPLYMAAMKKLGDANWLGIGWPKEHGGLGRGSVDQFIFFDEVQRVGFPVPILTLSTVGPTLLKFGTEEQKTFYPPKILRGECHFSIGYTEPGAGTDLASLRTSAVLDGDEWVINGQKIWTSLADHADYMWLACRTDPDAKAHKGISMIIIPLDTPGVQVTKMHALGDNNTHAVYYDNVRVPKSNLVGDLHGGWRLITTQLNHERVALNACGPIDRITTEVGEWAAETPSGQGGNVIDLPWVRANLAKVDAKLEALELMNCRQAWAIDSGDLGMADASAIKVYGSEFYVEASRLLMEVLGAVGPLYDESAGAALGGELERFYRSSLVLTFGGGVNEVQRDIIAMAGLGLPRMGRS
ncbi:MAG: alkylation response protein AidB-like acyl-CoA dehydrogenase [Bradymonadia bacterium]|jgi:alkylation response protein AidB-like acyl-CoA dehydrogenase